MSIFVVSIFFFFFLLLSFFRPSFLFHITQCGTYIHYLCNWNCFSLTLWIHLYILFLFRFKKNFWASGFDELFLQRISYKSWPLLSEIKVDKNQSLPLFPVSKKQNSLDQWGRLHILLSPVLRITLSVKGLWVSTSSPEVSPSGSWPEVFPQNLFPFRLELGKNWKWYTCCPTSLTGKERYKSI